MGSIERYIIRTTFGAFILILVSLTAVIWITNALRDLDLMTSQGQTILVFLGITGLIIPQLVMVIAPIALVLAVAHTLNKLATDSEIIVMNAAGMPPWKLFRAFLAVALIATAMLAVINIYLSPKSLRELRDAISEIRADIVTNIVKPGRFISIERGLTFHIGERRVDGTLGGIFVDDRRNPADHVTVLAERGEIVKAPRGTFLFLETGSLQRRKPGDRDPAIVLFDRYAFDLSQFTGGSQAVHYSVRERYLWELVGVDPADPIYIKEPGQFPAEFHDRIVGLLYPTAFVIIAFAYLGAPSTTRQSRNLSILGAIGAVAGLRMIGFASTVFGIRVPAALSIQYIAVFFAMAVGYWQISRGTIVEPPAFVTNLIALLTERLSRRVTAS
jgi:lipopolysaccharide export system permease protein